MNIEEVKEYFKNAKVVECLSENEDYNLNEINISQEIHLENNCFWIDYLTESDFLCSIELWNEEQGFAKIIEYKDEKLYTLKGEFKRFVIGGLKVAKLPLKEWVFPLSMLDEVKEVEVEHVGHGFNYTNNTFTYKCGLIGKVDKFDLSSHLEKATKEFFNSKNK
jgi:hypothetical protein